MQFRLHVFFDVDMWISRTCKMNKHLLEWLYKCTFVTDYVTNVLNDNQILCHPVHFHQLSHP